MIISPISMRGAEIGQPSQKQEKEEKQKKDKEIIKEAGKLSTGGAVVMGLLEFMDEADMIFDAAKCIKQKTDTCRKYMAKAIDNCKGNTEKIAKITDRFNKVMAEKVKAVSDFAAKGKFDFKRIAKAGVVGFAVIGCGYLICYGIKSLINKKQAKVEG